jgi:hypothetical protein
MRRWLLLAVLIGCSAMASAQVALIPFHDACTIGGTKVATQGMNSTTKVLASYPQCLVTVYTHGVTTPLPTIYSDVNGTALGNPFEANTDGTFTFFAPDVTLDYCMSNGVHTSPVMPTTRCMSYVTGAGSCGAGTCVTQANLTTVFESQSAANPKGATFGGETLLANGANLQSVLNATPANGVVDMGPVSSPITLASVLNIPNPVTIKGCRVQITCAMSDPGTSSGCINVAADDVTIEGTRKCIITQGNAADIQTAIYVGSRNRLTFRGFKIDWNEDNQTNVYGATGSNYYTGIRSAGYNLDSSLGSAHDIHIEDMEFTRTGHRAIDFRGTHRVWITGSYFHQTGVAVGGTGVYKGNSVSIDIGSTVGGAAPVPSYDSWCLNNIVEEQGDSFRCGNIRSHLKGNRIFGRAFFGNVPWWTETGIDSVGYVDAEIVQNSTYDIFNNSLSVDDLFTLGVHYTPTNIRISDNLFSCSAQMATMTNLGGGSTTSQCMVRISDAGYGTTLQHVTFSHNNLFGIQFVLTNVNGWTVANNTFDSFNGSAPTTYLAAINGANTKNFVIMGNALTNYPRGFNFLPLMTSPAGCTIYNNAFDSTVTFPYVTQIGAGISHCGNEFAGAFPTISLANGQQIFWADNTGAFKSAINFNSSNVFTFGVATHSGFFEGNLLYATDNTVFGQNIARWIGYFSSSYLCTADPFCAQLTYTGGANRVIDVASFRVPIYNTASASATSSISNVTMVASTPAGAMYNFTYLIKALNGGTGCTGTGTVSVQLNFTDADNSVSVSSSTIMLNFAGGATNTVTLTLPTTAGGVTATNIARGTPIVFTPATASAVTYNTTYAAGSGCSPGEAYKIYPLLEQVK